MERPKKANNGNEEDKWNTLTDDKASEIFADYADWLHPQTWLRKKERGSPNNLYYVSSCDSSDASIEVELNNNGESARVQDDTTEYSSTSWISFSTIFPSEQSSQAGMSTPKVTTKKNAQKHVPPPNNNNVLPTNNDDNKASGGVNFIPEVNKVEVVQGVPTFDDDTSYWSSVSFTDEPARNKTISISTLSSKRVICLTLAAVLIFVAISLMIASTIWYMNNRWPLLASGGEQQPEAPSTPSPDPRDPLVFPTTSTPSVSPTMTPIPSSTNRPISPSILPFTMNPTFESTTDERSSSSPTFLPTLTPTTFPPTSKPTMFPTKHPSNSPTFIDNTFRPSSLPTTKSSVDITLSPTLKPTTAAPISFSPTDSPSSFPTQPPTFSSTFKPSELPTAPPTTTQPTYNPSTFPSPQPSTLNPTDSPTTKPTFHVTLSPTFKLTSSPTSNPTTPAIEKDSLESYLPPSAPKEIVFHVMGDMPYAEEDYDLLKSYLTDLSYRDSQFLIHVGDMQRPVVTNCEEIFYIRIRKILEENSPIPTLIIPGDNDWIDCPNKEIAWGHWVEHLQYLEQLWQPLPFHVKHQPKRQENFAFVHENVLFLSVHIVNIYEQADNSEWISQHQETWFALLADNIAWTYEQFIYFGKDVHAIVIFGHMSVKFNEWYGDYFHGLVKLCDRMVPTSTPVVYIHGDGHKYKYYSPFSRENMSAIQVDEGANAIPLKVTIQPGQFSGKQSSFFSKENGDSDVDTFYSFEFDRDW